MPIHTDKIRSSANCTDVVYPAKRISIYGVLLDQIDWESCLARILKWAANRESRLVCLCNVHSLVTASHEDLFRQALRDADLVTPDGEPVAWAMRKQGASDQQRINGPDLMWRYCAQSPESSQAVFFYGSAEATLAKLRARLESEFPRLKIVGMYSPPFRPLTEEEDLVVTEQINASGAGVVFVSLGCPKQERWMAEHRGKIKAVMIGVGAAFDYHAKTIKRAPLWMQNLGLEWLYRLSIEPRRLWKRYLITNTVFIVKVALPLMLGRYR
jgi:N-acetylglucosaminyldiphosphoundecaprenol N-acetyl-beta-D-mannosaminyltransferase